MLSHRDSDHVGGAAALLRALPVGRIASSLEAGHPLRAAAPHQPCEAGQRWTWDGVRFEVLHPSPADLSPLARPNTLSCVLHVVDAAGRSLLLTGDIEAAQEAALLQRALPRADVLLVPHHGSRTSSTAAFIEAVAPHTAVVQAAYRSRFGHPAPDVVQRYTERGITVVRTDRCGAWTRRPDATQECHRAKLARYWHHRPA
jgi:competence protein ComEC